MSKLIVSNVTGSGFKCASFSTEHHRYRLNSRDTESLLPRTHPWLKDVQLKKCLILLSQHFDEESDKDVMRLVDPDKAWSRPFSNNDARHSSFRSSWSSSSDDHFSVLLQKKWRKFNFESVVPHVEEYLFTLERLKTIRFNLSQFFVDPNKCFETVVFLLFYEFHTWKRTCVRGERTIFTGEHKHMLFLVNLPTKSWIRTWLDDSWSQYLLLGNASVVFQTRLRLLGTTGILL